MIIGSCPYKGCDGRVWTSIPDDMPLPKYQRHKCEDCKRWMWTKHSRIDPCSWTERNFLKEYKVDKKMRQIELRNPPKPRTKKEKIADALVEAAMKKMIEDFLLDGIGYKFKDPSPLN